MITSAQIRAARGLLKWTQATLAAKASVSIVTLNLIESDSVAPRESTLAGIRKALEEAGVAFLGTDDGGVGVRFRAAGKSSVESAEGRAKRRGSDRR